jgi:hypothetical protein
MRFLQLLRALITANFYRSAADADRDGIRIQLAVASGTSFFKHESISSYPLSG